jgi:hypothetical protein
MTVKQVLDDPRVSKLDTPTGAGISTHAHGLDLSPAGSWEPLEVSGTVARLEALADCVNRNGIFCAVWFSLIYFACAVLLAATRPLWFDELLTLHVCRAVDLSDLWSRLYCENNPPLYFVTARLSVGLFGETALALRLPAMIGVWIFCLSIYRFTSPYCTALYGWLAALFPLFTYTYTFAWEARPSGLLLGCCGISLLSYQSATRGSGKRGLSLLALTLALAAAVSSHFYAVLFWIPLGLGELVRLCKRKQVDFPVASALILATFPVVFYLPLIHNAREYVEHFYAKVDGVMVCESYRRLLRGAAVPVLATLIALASYRKDRDAYARADHPNREGLPFHELTVLVGLILLPVFGYAFGKLVTGVYIHRCVLPAQLGFSILVAFWLYRHGQRAKILGVAFAGIFLTAYLFHQMWEYRRNTEGTRDLEQQCAILNRQASSDLPIVVSSPLMYLPLAHYGSRQLAERLVYVNSLEQAVRYTGVDTCDRLLRALGQHAPLAIQDYEWFLSKHSCFLVVSADCPDEQDVPPLLSKHSSFLVLGEDDWLLAALRAKGAQMDLKEEGPRRTKLSLVRQ